jgi:hypothetical protein
MDNGTTGRLAHGLRSIVIVGHATGYLFARVAWVLPHCPLRQATVSGHQGL